MSIASPLWLLLLVLAPLIVLLHMRRRRSTEVPSTKLWRLLAESDQPRVRLRRPPSLFALWMQLAVLALLSLVLAEPRMGGAVAISPSVLVVDASASMAVEVGGASRYRRALDAWLADLRQGGGPWSVWRASSEAIPLALEWGRSDALRTRLLSSSPGDGGVDWGALADALAEGLPAGANLVVATTDPDAATRALQPLADRMGATMDVRSYAAPFANVAVTEVEVALDERVAGRWAFDILLRRDGSEDERAEGVVLDLTFQPAGATTPISFLRRELLFNLGGTARIQETIDLPGAGLLQVSLLHDGQETYRSDDHWQAWLEPEARRPMVLLLSRRGAEGHVARALTALDLGDVLVTPVPTPGLLAEVDWVVVDGLGDVLAGLESEMPDAVLWLGTAPGVDDPASLPRIDPAATDWRLDHPLTAGTAWASLDPGWAVALPVREDTQVLVRGLDGPLVHVRAAQRREVLVALDPGDANWTSSAGFVTFLADAAAWLAPPEQAVRSCTVGASCRLPWSTMTQGAELWFDDEVVWRTPSSAGILPPRLHEAWVPERAGVYRLVWPGGPEMLVPVNPSGVGARSVQLATLATVPAEAPAAVQRSASGWPLYVFGLLLVLVLLLTEAAVAGRGNEAFLRLTHLRESGLLARRRRGTVITYLAVSAFLVLALVSLPWPRWLDPRVIAVVTDDAAVQSLPGWPEGRTTLIRSGTGSEGAIDLTTSMRRAMASFTPGENGRIRFETSAITTRGSASNILSDLLETGVPVDLAPSAAPAIDDVWVQRVGVDREPLAGDTVSLQATVVSGRPAEAQLLIWRDDVLEASLSTELLAGTSLLSIPVLVEEAGDTLFEVEVVTEGDSNPANDRGALLLKVHPAPRVHVITTDPDQGAAFVEAMGLQGMDAVIRAPHTIGTRVSDFFEIDVLVLMDIPAIELASTQQSAIETWVREAGGGLVIGGGERSFGPGGYHETPLDMVSPLAANVPRDAPEVAMVFVLDRSGSMQQTVDGVTRLDIAKGATLTAVGLLGEQSQVAIVVFDEEARTLLPLTSSADLEEIEAALRPLTPGGGTFMYPGLVAAAEILADTDVATRHVVVMTDGLSQPGDFGAAVAALTALDATVSSVAIGAGSDVTRVRELAELGGGVAHVTTDFRALPSILAQEAMMLSGDLVVRETVIPLRTGQDPGLMDGLPQVMPPLSAFVETDAKVDADVLLEDEDGRPLLAAWSYGAGRVVAFASYVVGPWSEAWASVQEYPRWWAQWSRWTAQVAPRLGLDLRARVVGDEVWVDVAALAQNGTAAGGLTLEAELVMEEASGNGFVRTARTLSETVFGRYQGLLPIMPGSAVVRVTALGDNAPEPVEVRVHHAYAAKLGQGWGEADLAAVVLATEGRMLTEDQAAWPEELGATWPWQISWHPSWRPWALLSLTCWLLALLARYAPGWLRWGVRRSSRRSASNSPGDGMAQEGYLP